MSDVFDELKTSIQEIQDKAEAGFVEDRKFRWGNAHNHLVLAIILFLSTLLHAWKIWGEK